MFSKILQNSKKTPVLENLLIKRHQHRTFSMDFAIFLKTTLFTGNLWKGISEYHIYKQVINGIDLEKNDVKMKHQYLPKMTPLFINSIDRNFAHNLLWSCYMLCTLWVKKCFCRLIKILHIALCGLIKILHIAILLNRRHLCWQEYVSHHLGLIYTDLSWKRNFN